MINYGQVHLAAMGLALFALVPALAGTKATAAKWAVGHPDSLTSSFTANLPAQLTAEQKHRAEALTSLFENDTPVPQYDYIENIHDDRGYTAGRAGFCTSTGDLLIIVERYTLREPGNRLARFLPRLRQLADAGSASVTGLKSFVGAWKMAARDPVFRFLQDQVSDELYYRPAMARASQIGLQWATSRAIIYDTIIQHGDDSDPDGLPTLIDRVTAGLHGSPGHGVSEFDWIYGFLRVRRRDLLHPYDVGSREIWPDSVVRVDAFKKILDSGNYDLHGPIRVKSYDWSGLIP